MIMVSGISRWGSVGAYLNDVFLREAGVLEGKDDPLWSLTSKRFPVLVFWGGVGWSGELSGVLVSL